MNIITKFAAVLLVTLSLAACGTGGSGGAAPSATSTPATIPENSATDTRISGVATKGPINGTASFFALNPDGSKGSLLKSSPIVFGSYSANIGKYAMPIVIEVTGSYTDEATGGLLTITADAPMRAALSIASSKIVAVTPLTELAVQKAGVLTAANIDAANNLVSDIFKFNIIDTQPVAPTNAAISAATGSQKDYTVALAAISQLSLTRGEPLAATLRSVANGISSTGMTSQMVAGYQKAVTDFIAGDKNQTGIATVAETSLAKINGGTTTSFTLAIQGGFAANAIKGIQFEVVIPPGLTLRYDAASGETLPGIVTVSPGITDANPQIKTRYSASEGVLNLILLTGAAGIGSGDLATFTCDIVPGWLKPSATTFNVRNIKAVDGTATFITGVSVTVK